MPNLGARSPPPVPGLSRGAVRRAWDPGALPCRWACLCLSPPCQDEPEARSAPLPLRSYPVFPVKEIWASRAEEHWGVPAAAAGLGQQRGFAAAHLPNKAGAARGLSAAHRSGTPWSRSPSQGTTTLRQLHP